MNTEATAIRERSSKTQFGPYEVLCREDGSIFRLGQGPTSSSYKAIDTDLRTPVVLKVMRPELFEDETARKRFLREARAAALLRHPNVAQIYRLGEQDGTCFYAREFVEGETLEARVNRDGPLGVPLALKVTLQVAETLVAVKEAHLVHRDIKPSNLMLTPHGEVKVIDFGLTKSNANGQIDGVGPITMNGFMGSSDYASPEQLNEEPLEVTSDMYSLGVTLWFLLTGRCPFRGAQVRVMSAHLNNPPPFEELFELPTPLVGLLAHMLEKDPARRPATPTELVIEILACMKGLNQTPDAEQRAGQAAPATMLAALPVPVPTKISPNREPVRDRSPRRFVLVELLVGTAIAVIMYLILSRPVDLPAESANVVDNTSENSRMAPPPAGTQLTAAPVVPADLPADASQSATASPTPAVVPASLRPAGADAFRNEGASKPRAKSGQQRTVTPPRERRSRLASDRQ